MAMNRHARMMADALVAGEDRDYQGAIELLTSLINETDDYPQAYLYLGRSYHALGRVQRAIQYLQFFVELEPDTGAGHFFLGRAYLAQGIYDRAVQHLGAAHLQDPDNSQVLGLLGITHLKLHQTEIAVEFLGRAVEIDPANRELHTGYLNTLVVESIRRYRRGDVDLARQMLEFLIDSGVTTTVTKLYLAHCYKELGRNQDALLQYDWILEREPDDPVLRLQQADMLLRMGEPDRARATLATVQMEQSEDSGEIDLDVPSLHRLMAIESFQKGEYRPAIEYAKSVIKQLGSGYEMHLLMGDAFRHIESFEKARNHFHRAARFESRRVEPHYGLMITAWQTECYEEVLSECRVILKIAPGDETALYYLALSRGMVDATSHEVIPALEAVLRNNGPDAYLCTSLGHQHLRNGSWEEAEKYFLMAIDISETHRSSYDGLFEVYEHLDRSDRAAELYHTYFEHFPADSRRRRDYIQVLVSMQRYELALAQIQLQLPFDGGSEGLRRLQAFCYRELSRYREAGIVYRQLLKEKPDSDFYLRALVFCLEHSGNRARALTLLEHAFSYKKPSATMRLIFGVLLYREKRLDDALSQFRTVLDEHGEDWRAYLSIASVYRKRKMYEMADRYVDRSQRLRSES